MKILFLSNYIWRDGAPLRLLEIVEYVKKNIQDIHIDIMADGIGIENIYAEYIDQLILIKRNYSNIERWKKKIKDYFFVGLLKRKRVDIVQELLKNKEYDVIYANTFVTLKRALFIKTFLPNIKIILHLRELETVCAIDNPNYKEDLKKVDFIVAISRSVYDFATKTCGVAEEKVELIYSGTHLETFLNVQKPRSEKIILGTIGGGSWRKGGDFLLAFAKKVNKKYPDIEFELIGNFSDHDKIIQKMDLEKMGMESKIKYYNSVSDIVPIAKNWHVFLSFAREEPLGVSCIELGAMGIPILAFGKSGGPDEILSDGGGAVSDYLDIDGMYSNLEKLLEENFYNQCSIDIRKNITKYDISNSLPKIANVVKSFSKNK